MINGCYPKYVKFCNMLLEKAWGMLAYSSFRGEGKCSRECVAFRERRKEQVGVSTSSYGNPEHKEFQRQLLEEGCQQLILLFSVWLFQAPCTIFRSQVRQKWQPGEISFPFCRWAPGCLLGHGPGHKAMKYIEHCGKHHGPHSVGSWAETGFLPGWK